MHHVAPLMLVGAGAGLIAGLFGVGGGILFVPALVLFAGLGQLQAEATSLLAIVPVAAVGAWRQHRYGNLRLRAGLVVGAVAIGGGVVGVAIANAVPERGLEYGFAALLLFTAFQVTRDELEEETTLMTQTTMGEGWAVGSIDGMGSGPGFRKVRRELDVKAFGVNAVVMPPGYASGPHFHDRQEELYLVHRGTIEFTFGDGEEQQSLELGAGGLARVDAATVRRFRNTSDTEEAVYLCVGGADGYVGRDGRTVGGEAPR